MSRTRELFEPIAKEIQLLQRLNIRQAKSIRMLIKSLEKIEKLSTESAKGTVLNSVQRECLVLRKKLDKFLAG